MSIRFACPKCQHSLKVPDELGGKRAKCPHCQAAIPVPGGNGVAVKPTAPSQHGVAKSSPSQHGVAKKPALVPTPKRPPSDEFLGLDKPISGPGAGKPYRRQRGNPVMKLMIVVLFFTLLVGGAIAAWKFKWVDTNALLAKVGMGSTATAADTAPKGTAPVVANTAPTGETKPQTTQPKEVPPAAPLTDSHFLPDGTLAIATVNFESLGNSKLYEKGKEELIKMELTIEKTVDPAIKPVLGLQFAALGRVTVAGAAGDESIYIVRPRNPVTIEQIKPNKAGDYKEAKVGRFTMFETSTDAYCLTDEGRMLVLGPAALLRKVLERDKPVTLSADLEAAYKQFAPAKTLAIAALPGDARKELVKVVPGGMDFKPPAEFEPAVQSKSVLVQIDLTQGLDVSAQLVCKDEAAATTLKKSIDGTLMMFKEQLEKIKKDNEGMPEEKQAQQALNVLAQVKVAADGATLSTTLALDNDMTLGVFDTIKQVLMAMKAQ